MRLPRELPPSEGGSTPHPIRHLKHILRHQMDHPSTTKLPPRLGGNPNSTVKLLLLSNTSSITPPPLKYEFDSSISGVGVGGPGSERGGVLNICYTTNEVLVIIGVTCFLNFAFILLIMSCVHFFSTRASRLKSAVLVAETGEEYYYEDFQDSDEECEWKTSLDKSFDQESKVDLLQYINNLP